MKVIATYEVPAAEFTTDEFPPDVVVERNGEVVHVVETMDRGGDAVVDSQGFTYTVEEVESSSHFAGWSAA